MISLPDALKHDDYSKIPPHLLQSIYGYVLQRQAVGHFLTALLCNDLIAAVGRADKETIAALRELVIFLHMEVPCECYGSAEKVASWLSGESRRIIRWSPDMLKRFKVAYEAAAADKADTFKFEDNEFVLDYAKYLIEHLEGVFHAKARP
jgi:hypothetical protein